MVYSQVICTVHDSAIKKLKDSNRNATKRPPNGSIFIEKFIKNM